MKRLPWTALVIAVLVQTAMTMASYSMSVVAPSVATDLGIAGSAIGLYTSVVYAFGTLSAVVAPAFVMRYGPMRVSQAGLALAAISVALAASSHSVALLALSGIAVGAGYGVPAPASSELLARRTPASVANLVFSLRQTGVPLGGIVAGLGLPPLMLALGWRSALLAELVLIAALAAVLQLFRREFDVSRDPTRALFAGGVLKPLRLIAELPALRWLSFASFVYAGVQLCFAAFMVVLMHDRVGLDVVTSGQVLAIYQIAGVVSRPIWGWIADRWVSARHLLAAQGLVMALAAMGAATFGPGSSLGLIALVSAVAGATASGFTGIAYAEYARIGGAERAALATGTGSSMMFFGVMLLPALFSAAVGSAGGYAAAFLGAAVLAAASGILLWISPGVPSR